MCVCLLRTLCRHTNEILCTWSFHSSLAIGVVCLHNLALTRDFYFGKRSFSIFCFEEKFGVFAVLRTKLKWKPNCRVYTLRFVRFSFYLKFLSIFVGYEIFRCACCHAFIMILGVKSFCSFTELILTFKYTTRNQKLLVNM